jgi:hypothetical protein
MKNFTIEFNTTDRHFALELTGTMRNFEIRPGVGPAGPAGPQGDEGPQGPQGDPGPNSVTSSTTSDGTADLSLNSLEVTNTTSANGIDINVTDSFYGIYALAENGIGVSGYSYDGSGIGGTSDNGSGGAFTSNNSYGAIITSLSLTALQLNTVSGNYYLECQNNYTTIEAAIERVRGWFVWFYNTFTGRLKTANITADRDWTLPDQSGIIAVSSIESANFTAANGGSYVTVNNATVTDPSPSEGAAFRVLVRNGTATVGGTAYSAAGTVIERVFHSGSWANYVYDTINSTATLTNKTISGASNTITNVPISTGVSGLGTGVGTALGNTANGTGGFVTADGTATLTNKTLTSPTIDTISGAAVSNVLQNRAGSTRPICVLFEDFPGLTGGGTHPWNDAGTGSTDASSTGGAGNFMGTCRLVTGTTSGNARSRSLGIATSTIFIGAIVRYGFAIPDVTNVNVQIGFSGGGSNCQLYYQSAANSGQWTLLTNAGVTTFTSATPQAGNYFSGKRYQVEIERISATQTRILLEIADFNLANWSTVHSGTITHSSVVSNWGECTPSFAVTTQTAAARTIVVDWASLHLPMILR